MNKPKDWWGNPNNAQKWIDQVNKHNNDLSYTEQPNIVLKELSKHINKFNSIIEVGSGTGHIIDAIQKKYPEKNCYALDINIGLLEYVKSKNNKIKTYEYNITENDHLVDCGDLVITYQVLQHIHPDNIISALHNLKMLAFKEVWMWEGIGKYDGYKNGDKTHNAHNGSWVYHINEMIDCYEVSIPQNKNIKLNRQRLYKVKI